MRHGESANDIPEIIWRLGRVAELKDCGAGNHVVRVGHYSRSLAAILGCDSQFSETIFHTSPLHDIGKIAIPDRILLKEGGLTPEEREIIEEHCIIGATILRENTAPDDPDQPSRVHPLLDMAATIARSHHERWDGTGYPDRLAGTDIPLEARIVAICDVYDALRSKRSYKAPCTEAEARAIMNDDMRPHFDPDVYDAFEGAQEEFRTIRHEFPPDIPTHLRKVA